MLFKNNTNKPIKVRVVESTTQHTYAWKTVKPDKTIELPQQYGLKMGLTPEGEEYQEDKEVPDNAGLKKENAVLKKQIKEKDKEIQELKAVAEGEKDNEPEGEKDTSEYKAKLLNLHGIGEKTVEDITKDYPTEDLLRAAIKDETHLPFDDDVVELLKTEFGE